MTSFDEFTAAFPSELLYEDPGWISVHRTIDDQVIIVRSHLIRSTDCFYVECLQHVGDLNLTYCETFEHRTGWWIGTHVTAEVWT